MEGGQGSGATYLAAGRFESALQTQAPRPAVVKRRFLHSIAAAASQSRLELRFRRSSDARWAQSTLAGDDRRVYAGVPGDSAGATVEQRSCDRTAGRLHADTRSARTCPIG